MERIRTEWLIFFYTPFKPPFYTKWRKKGFTHVGGLHFCPKFKCWVLLEGLYGRLHVEVIDGNEAEKVLSYVKRLKGIVLKGEELDFVSICTWTRFHKEMVVAAANSDIKAIHCEKPMAHTWGESKDIYQACVDKGVIITFCHQRRFRSNYARAKELLEGGALGS